MLISAAKKGGKFLPRMLISSLKFRSFVGKVKFASKESVLVYLRTLSKYQKIYDFNYFFLMLFKKNSDLK